MGAEIIIPVVVLAIVAPIGFMWARRTFKEAGDRSFDEDVVAPSDRFTSEALRKLDSPPWRVVYEIPPDKLDGVAHVLVGPAGIFALKTSMESMPEPPDEPADARAISEAAIARGDLNDALRRCAMSSDRLVTVHWGPNEDTALEVELLPGASAVDGRHLVEWADGLADASLTSSQVDLAWQTIVTAIGRPDPLS